MYFIKVLVMGFALVIYKFLLLGCDEPDEAELHEARRISEHY
jgi:hypothetical protein